MTARVPSASVVGLSELPLHSLRFHKRGSRDGTGKADAFRTDLATDLVEGVVYAIDPDDLPELDRIEGLGVGYHRRLMPFPVTKGGVTVMYRAWVYVARREYIDDSLTPNADYLRHVIDGAREHGLSRDLVTWLEAHPFSET